jgi:hypothetical protein
VRTVYPMPHGMSDEAYFLHSISRRYPSIVTRATLDRWTHPTFRGPLCTDPSIVSLNPSSGSGGGGSSGSRGFGGGSSFGGGGGGGGW